MRPGPVTAVGAGGALGTLGRYGLTVAFPVTLAQFPWTTLGVNLVGSFALGLVLYIAFERQPTSGLFRPFLAVGLLGGFTTFSTVAVEVVQRGRHDPTIATAYLAANVGGGPLAVLAGAGAIRWIYASRTAPP